MNNKDTYILSRFMYKIGRPILSDQEYDKLEKSLEGDPDLRQYMNRTWEDDPIPVQLLKEHFGEEETEKILQENRMQETSHFGVSAAEFKAQSIKAVRTLEEAYDWFNAHCGVELILMPKVDGNSTSSEYKNNNHEFSRTRGRGGPNNYIDITTNCAYALPAVISDSFLTVNAEAYVPESAIPYFLQFVQNVNFTSPRACGLSAIRRSEYSPGLLKQYLKLAVFNVSYGRTLSEGLDHARDLGFDVVVPYTLRTFPRFESLSEFEKIMREVMGDLKRQADEIEMPTDGVVVQVNDRQDFAVGESLNDKYVSTNLAFKCLFWDEELFESTVRDIQIIKSEKSKQNFSVKLLVEPVLTRTGKQLQTVNMFNLANLIQNDVYIGDRIIFKHFNDTSIEFVRKVET